MFSILQCVGGRYIDEHPAEMEGLALAPMEEEPDVPLPACEREPVTSVSLAGATVIFATGYRASQRTTEQRD